MFTIPRNALYGALSGLLWSATKDDELGSITAKDYFETSNIFSAINAVYFSIHKCKALDSKDIAKQLENFQLDYDKNNGEILCWIFPVGFFTAYDHTGTMSENVVDICKVTHDFETTKLVAVEYVRLIHDIFWKKLDYSDELLDILPELDILAGDVQCSRNAKNVFFASLWAFAHSENFESAMNNIKDLDNANECIYCVTGTLAGLYYGLQSIPKDFIEKTQIDSYIDNIPFY